MNTSTKIPELDRRGLRQFGVVTGALLSALFGVTLPWLLGYSYPLWPWIVTALLVAWASLHPTSLSPLYRAWMRLGLLMSRVTTPLLLGLVFFMIFTPVALAMRLAGRDTMQRKIDPAQSTYRKASRRKRSSLENPF